MVSADTAPSAHPKTAKEADNLVSSIISMIDAFFSQDFAVAIAVQS
jgi:hypothetical protein